MAGKDPKVFEQSLAVAASEVETRRERCDSLSNRRRVILSPFNDLVGDLGDRGRINVIGEEVGDHASWPRHRESKQRGSVVGRDDAAVKANVGSASLPPRVQRELMHVGPQVTGPVELSGG